MAAEPKVKTRDRMVVSTALLIRERGARATSIDDVLAHSGAPRGSVYHHFPGGREQLLAEAIDFAGDYVAGRIAAAPNSVAMLDSMLDEYRDQLLATDFRAGCPVVAVAVEAGDPDGELGAHAQAAFARWLELFEDRLAADGVKPKRAQELATLTLSAIEGAIVLARVRREIEPLASVHRQLRSLLRAETKGSDR